MRLRLLGSFFYIPRHFQARQQLDIARGAVHAGFIDAIGFVSCTGLNPKRLELVARYRLIVDAFLQHGFRPALGPTLRRYIEFRQIICDSDE